jgi:hypothetical protein
MNLIPLKVCCERGNEFQSSINKNLLVVQLSYRQVLNIISLFHEVGISYLVKIISNITILYLSILLH